MTDHSPEATTQEAKGGELSSRFQRAREVWDTRTEEERAMGLLVRRYESGDPIQLEVSPSPQAGFEVSRGRWGDRKEASPQQIPLRLNLREREIPQREGEIIHIPTKDPQQTIFLEIMKPLSSANGRAVGESVFVMPLNQEESQRVQDSGKYVDYKELLAEKTVKMLEGREVLRVMGAQPSDIEVLTLGPK